jgi:hypothetical protein
MNRLPLVECPGKINCSRSPAHTLRQVQPSADFTLMAAGKEKFAPSFIHFHFTRFSIEDLTLKL